VFVSDDRIIPLTRECITTSIRSQDVGCIWTVERALQYLIVGGLVTDAVWFVNAIGDWKAAFTMSAVVTHHSSTAAAAAATVIKKSR